MKPEILLIEPMLFEIENRLDHDYVVHRWQGRGTTLEAALRIRGIATGGATGVPAELMSSLPNLEIIAINGIGTDAVDLVEAKNRKIGVTTTPGLLTEDVADMALGLILCTLRGLPEADRFVRDDQWGKVSLPLAHTVTGKRLGILGMGRVGRAIAHRAAAFGMDIAYTDVARFEDVPQRYVATLHDLAHESDVLVVAASGGPASRHLVNRTILDALGPHGILINVARGSVVDEQALIAALEEGRLGGAGLDVFADEPHVPSALRLLQNVVLQPHRASATVETRLKMGTLVADNLAAHFAGKPLLTPV
ncbi:2-hydroxyacid dehydrogenase [Beijerinckia indica]|uniref:D-isomer specific 2-hydroxyacid dehydrogenase NAD-binding n=1 Tax=Beijerinckia indica subsp. indica (strain ATCC 9039 / DSM 1715 / NCIMB 8712) TaxID=395963 RepID=B2IFR1_BEII9|nr:2-hydroxyacid dehydrogenase [Beijerinckia indica]ACB94272.1 D-isomer specific 2-hydroxyacid dehydrogenase NAD-binding [Beijerinckia indica subsp. indica ATCC 9039]